MTRTIIFTGGGTAGHVTPNISLIEVLDEKAWVIHYVGSQKGIERELISQLDAAFQKVAFHSISTGKLRRYFSWQNFIDPFFILFGLFQSIVLCLKIKPDVVFSKGGFVAVPLVVAAWLCRVPIISHESDTTPGLANKLCYPFSTNVCVTFPQTAFPQMIRLLPKQKIIVTGSPVRESLRHGDVENGRKFFPDAETSLPRLLVFGGSLGSVLLNRVIRDSLNDLTKIFTILHITGSGNLDENVDSYRGYRQVEYLHQEFGDVLAAADLVIGRAGANTIYELLITRTPNILVPLSAAASRGDQLVNARTFKAAGYSEVILEESLNAKNLTSMARRMAPHLPEIKQKLAQFKIIDSPQIIIGLIDRLTQADNKEDA